MPGVFRVSYLLVPSYAFVVLFVRPRPTLVAEDGGVGGAYVFFVPYAFGWFGFYIFLCRGGEIEGLPALVVVCVHM